MAIILWVSIHVKRHIDNHFLLILLSTDSNSPEEDLNSSYDYAERLNGQRELIPKNSENVTEIVKGDLTNYRIYKLLYSYTFLCHFLLAS